MKLRLRVKTHQVKFNNNFWNTLSRKARSSFPVIFLSILNTRKVAL